MTVAFSVTIPLTSQPTSISKMSESDKTNSIRHDLIKKIPISESIEVAQIEKEASVTVFRDGDDTGYHDYGTQWWINQECPYSYQYLNLDELYDGTYFDSPYHPSKEKSGALYEYMQTVYSALFSKRFESVLELGTGGGEITRHFEQAQLDYIAVEGTTAGVQKLKSIGIPEDKIRQKNLKFLDRIERRFDLVMCTEVAEHLEPWFASKVVSNCVEHSDAVWFSSARGDAPPHYHHMNEVPAEAWDNLFAHFGFQYFVELNRMAGRADRLYLSERGMEVVRLVQGNAS